MEQFTGIPKEGFAFLMDIRFHNNRQWFQAHKDSYVSQVKKPMYTLAAALAPTAREIDAQMETRPERVVSRIYRDARRVRGGAFYRDVVWLSFKRAAGGDEKPPFSTFFYCNPDEYGWGCGFWDAKPQVMEDLRRKIDAQPERFRSIVAAPWVNQYTLDGEDYKRPKKLWDDDVINRWYQKKNWSLEQAQPVDTDAFSPQLLARIEHSMRQMAPIYHFVMGMED
ncbi:MAG: DUF2461 domain-containing protein [Eubacteriales bacterium]|nr:DUF2461 domain-containing protein [Eubacteriales bacterium]